MPIYYCEWCRGPFTARSADRKRGWARFCSKSCKAKKQEKRTGQNATYHDRHEHNYGMDAVEQGWDAHKVWSDK